VSLDIARNNTGFIWVMIKIKYHFINNESLYKIDNRNKKLYIVNNIKILLIKTRGIKNKKPLWRIKPNRLERRLRYKKNALRIIWAVWKIGLSKKRRLMKHW
jgi:hypothetical protein